MPVLPDVTGGLAAELAGLRELDPQALAEGDTIVALHEQLAILQALVTRSVAVFDAGRSWEADGARSAASWVGTRCKVPTAVSRQRVRLGRDLRHMPEVEKAWLAGEINEFHVSLLARARGRNAEAFMRDEELLVGEAKRLRYVQFVKALAYWEQLADPDGAEERAEEGHSRRRYHHSKGFDGLYFADGIFDAIGGAVYAKVLGDIYDELFEQDWAEAKARVGEGVTVSDLARTPAQRRADAVVEMARRAAAMPQGARKPEPLFTVVVGYDRFARACELWQGTVVTPGQLVPWLEQGWVERVVFDGAGRVIDVGEKRRFFSGALRRAIEVRDRVCSNEFCDVPAEGCEIDHVDPYCEGGLTTAENGRPACGYHNRWKEKRRQEQRRGPPEAG